MSAEAAQRADGEARPSPVGPGRLVLVVGPSGAGKDSLLQHARSALERERGVVFVRRVVTRSASTWEDHDSISPEEFPAAVRQGAFALTWFAHGLSYGIPASIDADITAGSSVVCNASRTIVAAARQRYQRVVVALITAPAEVLQARLAARRRGSDLDLGERLARAPPQGDELRPDHVIDNAGALERAAADLIAVIRDR